MEWFDVNYLFYALAAFATIGLAVAIKKTNRSKPGTQWRHFDTVPINDPNQIARIEEIERMTGGGIAGVLVLCLFGLFTLVWLLFSSTILQQTVVLLAWIGIAMICGLAIVVGRKRTYCVYRIPTEP